MAWTLDHWINGASHAPANGRYLDRTSPVDGSLVCRIADGTGPDIDSAVAAAKAAQRAWARTAPSAISRAPTKEVVPSKEKRSLPSQTLSTSLEME